MKDTQLALPHNDPKKMGTTAKVSAKELEDFESFIKIINTKSHFGYFNLVGGVFRAYSKDRACIVETGCRFLRDMDFSMTEFRGYIELISRCSDKKNDTSVTEDDRIIKIKTNKKSLQFPRSVSFLVGSYYKLNSDKKELETLLENEDPNI